HPNTRRYVRLLGPCFKTGRLKPLCQHPKHVRGRIPAIKACCVPQSQPLYVTGGYKFTRGYYVPPAFIQRSKLMLTPLKGSTPAEPAESKEHD
ncbi:hypothetical protein HD553DRAFT_275042, partial [Filobasidium floriforme]